jgi:hypothetical protein
VFSDGWLHGFKRCRGIRQVALHGEANSADQDGEKLACKNMRFITEGYDLDYVYNPDKTGVFWRQLPRGTLATDK